MHFVARGGFIGAHHDWFGRLVLVIPEGKCQSGNLHRPRLQAFWWPCLQAIQKQQQLHVAVQSSSADLPMPEENTPSNADSQQSEQSPASEQSELQGVTSTEDFKAGILSAAKRLALTYRSQKKMLLWDVVFSLQS